MVDKDYFHRYYLKNREKIRQRAKQWRTENMERWKQTHKAWFEKNREKVNKYNKQYRADNPAKYKRYDKKSAVKRKEYLKQWRINRLAKQAQVEPILQAPVQPTVTP